MLDHKMFDNRINAIVWRPYVVGAMLLLILGILFLTAPRTEAQEASPLDPDIWEETVHLASTASSSDFTPSPQLSVAPNGTMIVAFNYITAGRQTPYFSRSLDGGQNWSSGQPIFSGSTNARHVRLTHDANSVAHAVWRTASAVYHAAETQWPIAAPAPIPSPASGEQILDPPAITLGPSNRLHVVWAQGDGQPNVYHAFSNNGGNSWTTSPALATNTQRSSAPAISVDSNGVVHIVWEERVGVVTDDGYTFEFKIHYRRGVPAGGAYNWGTSATVVSGALTSAKRPAILAQGTNLHVAFTQQEGDLNDEHQYPYYRTFSPGQGWSPLVSITGGVAMRVNTSTPYYLHMTLTSCQSEIYLYFHGATSSNAQEQIWGATSKTDWSFLDTVTTSDQRHVYPSLGCYNNNLHMAFERVVQNGTDHHVFYSSRRHNVHLPFMARP